MNSLEPERGLEGEGKDLLWQSANAAVALRLVGVVYEAGSALYSVYRAEEAAVGFASTLEPALGEISASTLSNLEGSFGESVEKINPLENSMKVSGKFPETNGPINGTLFRSDNEGNINSYAKYDDSGNIIKRVDLRGKPHGDIPTPHVVEYRMNTLPDGSVRPSRVRRLDNGNSVRPARPEELP